jgi:hypothetical protein
MKKLLLAVSMLFATSSFAGVLIEPQLGFKFAGSADTRAHGNNVAYKYSGVDIGGRLGYQMLGVMGGLNYNMSSFSKDAAGASISPTSATVDVDQTSIGVYLELGLPIISLLKKKRQKQFQTILQTVTSGREHQLRLV